MCHFPNLEMGKHPFSQGYEVILLNSFNTNLSSTLVYSTCSLVSVWGMVCFPLKGIQILPIPLSFSLEVYWPTQSSNSQVGKKPMV